jgi:dihydroorotate dehydrogenase (fumarate)
VIDLRTEYLGLKLSSPLVPSSSPLAQEIANLKRMEDAGAGAVVLQSLFEEQIELEARTLQQYLMSGTESYAEALTYLPEPPLFRFGPEQYLDHVRRAKRALGIPVIASLNGSSTGGWLKYARLIEQAGADALEINLYHIPANCEVGGREIEERALEVVRQVRGSVCLPVAVKIGPYYSAMADMACSLVDAGASGLVLFNRFYQPDIDLETLEVRPNVVLSESHELRLRLRWIAILYGRIKAGLAATGGVHTHEDALKALMAGADVAMLCSALLRHGIGHLEVVRAGLVRFMEEREYESIVQMKGSMSQRACADPTAFERASYMKALTGYHVSS